MDGTNGTINDSDISASATTVKTTNTSVEAVVQVDDDDTTKATARIDTNDSSNSSTGSTTDYYLGMLIASCFSLIYFIAPFYIVTGLYCLVVGYPTRVGSVVYCLPLLISAILPSRQLPFLFYYLRPMRTYFQYEEIRESKPINVFDEIMVKNKKFLCVCQPHGAISFAGICSVTTGLVNFTMSSVKFPTAVADALLYTPILKHFLGIFGLISASKQSLQHIFRSKTKVGPEGCVILYVGGMAELFLSSQTEEVLYLNNRKGFIKLALQEGVDIIPIYLFGNTSVLSVVTNNILASISRKIQVSLTYVWGRYYLPIPRDCKLLYVSGQPLGMPQIINPTTADVDLWHAKYCSEVTRIFNTYKERVPEYKHKQLRIV